MIRSPFKHSKLGIRVTLLFNGIGDDDPRLRDLQLFESLASGDTVHRSATLASGTLSYGITIATDTDRFERAFHAICDELIQLKPILLEMGLIEQSGGFDFWPDYRGQLEWNWSHADLSKLKNVSIGQAGIPLTSRNLEFGDDDEAFYQEVFHQIIFSSNARQVHHAPLQALWRSDYGEKYGPTSIWHDNSDPAGHLHELVLSIKEDPTMHEWDEAFTNLLSFLEKHMDFLSKQNILTSFGLFQHNRADVSGGETGKGLIPRLLELGLGLRITMDTRPPGA